MNAIEIMLWLFCLFYHYLKKTIWLLTEMLASISLIRVKTKHAYKECFKFLDQPFWYFQDLCFIDFINIFQNLLSFISLIKFSMLKKNDSHCLYTFIKKYNFEFIVLKMPVVEPFYKSSVKTTTNYINVWLGYQTHFSPVEIRKICFYHS